MTTLDTAAVWKDAKRYWWLFSPMVPPLVAWSLWNFTTTGQGAWLWGAWILIYALIPALDVLIGTDRSNPPEDATLGLEADRSSFSGGGNTVETVQGRSAEYEISAAATTTPEGARLTVTYSGPAE